MPFYSGTSHILQPNPILGIPDFRQSTNPQISVKAQPHADLLSTSFRFRAFSQFIWHGNRDSTGLQGTSACAMVCRKITDLPRIAVQALHSPFLQFILHPNRHSTGLQGTSARAMASICVHRAPQTPPDSTPGHIGSRDDWQEDHRPTTELPRIALSARPGLYVKFTVIYTVANR